MNSVIKSKMYTEYRFDSLTDVKNKQKELSLKWDYVPNIKKITTKKGESYFAVVEPGPALGGPNFSSARSEAQNWVSGMGESIKDNSLLGGYYRKKDAVRLLNKTRVPRNLGVAKTVRGHVHKYYILKGSGDDFL